MHHVEGTLWRCLNAQCSGSSGDISVALAHGVPVPQFMVLGLSYFRLKLNTWRLLTRREESTKVTVEVVNKLTQYKMLRSSLKDTVKLNLDRQ